MPERGTRSPLRGRFGFSRIGGRVHAPLPTVSATGATRADGNRPACDSRRPSPAPPYQAAVTGSFWRGFAYAAAYLIPFWLVVAYLAWLAA